MTSLIFSKRFPLRPVNLTSAVAVFLFAMLYGLIEHMLLLAILISFNPFFDKLLFRTTKVLKVQGLLWGTGNILNFIWLEDMFYFALFGEWPKDVLTPLNLSFYGIVWWYPLLFGSTIFLYYLTARSIRKMIPPKTLAVDDDIS
jgi:hypothetical protein